MEKCVFKTEHGLFKVSAIFASVLMEVELKYETFKTLGD